MAFLRAAAELASLRFSGHFFSGLDSSFQPQELSYLKEKNTLKLYKNKPSITRRHMAEITILI